MARLTRRALPAPHGAHPVAPDRPERPQDPGRLPSPGGIGRCIAQEGDLMTVPDENEATHQLNEADLKALAQKGDHAAIDRAHREGRLDDLLKPKPKTETPPGD